MKYRLLKIYEIVSLESELNGRIKLVGKTDTLYPLKRLSSSISVAF